MEYKPTKVTSMFKPISNKPVNNKTKNDNDDILLAIVDTLNSVNKLLITSNLSDLVKSHVKAKKDKKTLEQKVIEGYLKYKEYANNSNKLTAVVTKSGFEIDESLGTFASKLVASASEFFGAVILPIIETAWLAMTAVLEFVASTMITFVLAPIAEVITTLVVANPIVWGVAGAFAIAAGGYYLYKRLTGGSITEDYEKVKAFVEPVTDLVSPYAESAYTGVKNILGIKQEFKVEPEVKTDTGPRYVTSGSKNGITIPKNAPFMAGNISNLNSAETQKLANVTAMRESSNTLNMVNDIGYIGLYQFGAQALATVGFVKLNEYNKFDTKKGKKSYKNQFAFLSDDNNWAVGNLDTYLHSKEMQDSAFKKLADSNIKSAPEEVKQDSSLTAGFILGAHLLGSSAAKEYFSLSAACRIEYDKKHKDANKVVLGEYARLGYISIASLQQSTTVNGGNVNLGAPINAIKLTEAEKKAKIEVETLELEKAVRLAKSKKGDNSNNSVNFNTEILIDKHGNIMKAVVN